MHTYLRSAGFSEYKSRHTIKKLLDQLQAENMDKAKLISYNEEEKRWEIKAPVSDHMGICMLGCIDKESRQFIREYYFPYLDSDKISSRVPCSIQRHIDYDIYSGLLDDNRVGISLIFRLLNNIEFVERFLARKSVEVKSTYLSAWCASGKIILPVKKMVRQVELAKTASKNRDSLIEAAKKGDESAIESLSEEDMNLYAMVSRRLAKEDIYSIIDSCFMPQGIECDIYSIIGDILAVDLQKNSYTEEEIYLFTVDCNDIIFRLAINSLDLEGEPSVGRRFKGRIWMQGRVEFET
ncbi:MAG: DUF3881 family protein [Johnsonella sp.]|nr:DUF3881 family protein [Johnsonella sp.]